jgi:hypothetical protein
MVAGWDEYISICFAGKKMPAFRKYTGRKLVRYDDKYRLLHDVDEARTAQKRFVWIKKSGEEVELKLSGWHDQ